MGRAARPSSGPARPWTVPAWIPASAFARAPRVAGPGVCAARPGRVHWLPAPAAPAGDPRSTARRCLVQQLQRRPVSGRPSEPSYQFVVHRVLAPRSHRTTMMRERARRGVALCFGAAPDGLDLCSQRRAATAARKPVSAPPGPAAPGRPASASSATSLVPLHTSRPGRPSRGASSTAREGREVAQVVAARRGRSRRRPRGRTRGGPRPCPCRAGAVPGPGGPVRRSGRAGRPGRRAVRAARRRRPAGRRRGGCGPRPPGPSPRSTCRARRRSRRAGRAVRRGPRRRPGAARAACTVPLTASQRSAP